MMRLFLFSFFLYPSANAFWFEDPTLSQQNSLLEFGQAAELNESSPSTFILTTWNLYKGGIDGMYSDLEQIVSESDFVLMQEILLNESQQTLIAKTPQIHWAMAKSFEDNGEWTGVATASKWQPYESVPVRSPGEEPLVGTPKMSLISKFKLQNGEELWIVNIHALNFDITHLDFMDQVDALAQLLKQHQGPMIFAGDFNTWADVRTEYLLEVTKNLGLKQAHLENPIGIFSATLDHIFYRGFLKVKPSLLSGVVSSDHNPMRLEFTLQNSPAGSL